MFLDRGLFKYQYIAAAGLFNRAVFALADDPSYGQYCAWVSNTDSSVKEKSFEVFTAWEKLEIAAIGNCEMVKPAYVKTPCKVFARNNDITWGQQKKMGLD
jgi:hypothetical protein